MTPIVKPEYSWVTVFRPYLLIIAAGLIVRILFLAIIEPSAHGDGSWYIQAASSIRNGHVPDLFRPPFYPLFLAILPTWQWAFFIQPILTVIVSCFCYKFTKDLLAALLLAVCPFLIVYEQSILAETLSIALLISAWLLLSRKGGWAAGVLLGLLILTRDTYLLLPLFALPFGVWLNRGKQFLIAAAVAYTVITPWIVSQGSLSSGRGGYALWIGTWERNGDWQLPGLNQAAYPREAFAGPEQEEQLRNAFRRGEDEVFKRVALERIQNDPVGTLTVWLNRYPKLWLGTRTEQADLQLTPGTPWWVAFKSIMWGTGLLVLIFGSAGIIMTRQYVFALPILYIAVIYIPFHNTETRYSLPAIPFMLIYCSMAIKELVKYFKKTSTG